MMNRSSANKNTCFGFIAVQQRSIIFCDDVKFDILRCEFFGVI